MAHCHRETRFLSDAMNIGLGLEIDAEIRHLSVVVQRIEENLVECIAGKDYGEGVDHFYIGLVLVRPEANKFHPTRPLSYKRLFRYRDITSGATIELNNLVEYDVRPDYETLCTLATNEAHIYIADAVLKSVEILQRHRSKFPKFDLERFNSDIAVCLKREWPIKGDGGN